MVTLENIDIDIDKDIHKNIDIDIDKEILENIDIDKVILENIDIDIDIEKDILGKKSIFFQQKLEFFHAFLIKNRYRLSIYRLFLKYWWNIDTYFENIDIEKISIRKFGKYRYR